MKIKENRQKLKNPKFEKNEKQNFKKMENEKIVNIPKLEIRDIRLYKIIMSSYIVYIFHRYT
jgi:hypothetical protein